MSSSWPEDTMPSPQCLSPGVELFLEQIRPHGRKETAYPYELNATATRREHNETVHQWFVRLVDTYCQKDPSVVAIEDNIAVFASLKWDKDALYYASIPTLITESSVEEFYLYGKAQVAYLRLDLNLDTLGDPFSHPLPHIHLIDDLHPRFALDGRSGNVLVDYLEFLYRNFQSGKWVDWARHHWRTERGFPQDNEIDPFELVLNAFTDAQISILRENAPVILQINRTLRRVKDSFFSAHMEPTDRELLAYPSFALQ
jgi:hypothetical protein